MTSNLMLDSHDFVLLSESATSWQFGKPTKTHLELKRMAAINHYFEEFEVGVRYPTTSRLVTLEDHLAFCKLVRYEVPLFLDEEAGAKTNFAGMICPSHLIMSFTTAMTGALFSKSILGLLAIERAKFHAPVRPGDTLRTEVEVIDKRLTSDGEKGVVTFRDEVFNQFDKLVFQNDKIALIKCKSALKTDTESQ